jgi:hypothetical protein
LVTSFNKAIISERAVTCMSCYGWSLDW